MEDVFPMEMVPFLEDMLVFGGVTVRNVASQKSIRSSGIPNKHHAISESGELVYSKPIFVKLHFFTKRSGNLFLIYISIYKYILIYIYIARLNNPFVKLHGKIHPPPDNKSCQHNHSPRPRRPASRNPRSPNSDPRMPPTRPGKVIPMPICNEISETQRVFQAGKKGGSPRRCKENNREKSHDYHKFCTAWQWLNCFSQHEIRKSSKFHT